jgi:ABC-2 type transport system permease protein
MSLAKALTRILTIVGKELVVTVRRPGALFSLVLGPFLIMAIFGAGYSGYRRPLNTVVVIPPETGLPADVETYAQVAGDGLKIVGVTADETEARRELAVQDVDVVIIAPSDATQRFRQGERTTVTVVINSVDPVGATYATFLAKGLENQINQHILRQAAAEGATYALQHGADPKDVEKIPPDLVSSPTKAEVENVGQSSPSVVQFFGPAVLALILQHMAATLIALSVVRERTSGLFELFRISPISTFEFVTGKLIAFGLFSGAIALLTILLLVFGLNVPILGDPAWIALVVLLLIGGSLGIGLLIAAVSDSEPQTVQLSLLLLLASVFFSGFALSVEEFREPIRSAIHILPVTNGIRLLGDFLFRGGTIVVWQIWLLGGLALGYIAASWLLLRRALTKGG